MIQSKATSAHVTSFAEADVSKIVDKLSWLIENPIHLKNISINARKFIEIHHNYKSIALKYINNWKK